MMKSVYNDEFKNLEVLVLNFNAFKIFPAISIFTNLRNLDLTGNQIEILPHFISKMVSLQELYLNGNLARIHNLTPSIQLLVLSAKLTLQETNCKDFLTNLELSQIWRNCMLLTIRYHPLHLKLVCVVCDLLTLGLLRRLEELNLNGNPLKELPRSIGCCVGMEVGWYDCSSCKDIGSELL